MSEATLYGDRVATESGNMTPLSRISLKRLELLIHHASFHQATFKSCLSTPGQKCPLALRAPRSTCATKIAAKKPDYVFTTRSTSAFMHRLAFSLTLPLVTRSHHLTGYLLGRTAGHISTQPDLQQHPGLIIQTKGQHAKAIEHHQHQKR